MNDIASELIPTSASQLRTCDVCGKQIDSVHFSRHLQSHEAVMFCNACDFHCNRRDSLQRHAKKFHSDEVAAATSNVVDSARLLTDDELQKEIISFSVTIPHSSKIIKSANFLRPFSCKVVGPRGSGKTSFVVSYIQQIALKTFHKIVIVSATPHQDSYLQLNGEDKVLFLTIDEMQVFLEEATNVLVVLDDIMQETRCNVTLQNLYTRGRHKLVSIISLEQDMFYSSVVERRNVDYYVLMKIRDTTPLVEFYKKFCQDIQQWRFIDLYKFCTAKHCGYMIVDFVSPYFKYRLNSLNNYFNFEENKIANILDSDKDELDKQNFQLQEMFLQTMSLLNLKTGARKY
jgi:GTPase SAR1 family protein